MATSVPFHFPWKTVPNAPEPISRRSSRSSFLII
uniref:STY2 n=1 Tax=Arundo donax TaxID=35708 RepID=A0A0A9EI73_ARUDO